MNYKGHIVGGVVTYVVALLMLQPFIYQCNMTHYIQWFLFCILGALFPDIDTKSKIQLWIYRLFLIFYLLLLAINPQPYILISVSIFAITPLIVHHRGLFHKTWFLFGLPMAIVGIIYTTQPALATEATANAGFFILGALSHLYLD